MATNNQVSNAVGTQRQFSIQPKSVYQQNIRPLQVGSGISSRTDLDAATLSNALGLLGNNIIQESIAKDKRRKEYAQLAKHAINATSAEDLKKLKSVEIIGKYSNFDLADNPYATALVEEARGNFIRQEVQSEFANEDFTTYKDSKEAVAAYEDRLKTAVSKGVGNSDNSFAFEQGAYERHPEDVLKVANKHREEKAENMKQTAYAAVDAKFGEIILGSKYRPLEETLKDVDDTLKSMRLQGKIFNSKALRVMMPEILGQLAKESGNAELIEKTKSLIVEVDSEGTERTLGEYVNYAPIKYVTSARASQIRDQAYLNFEKQALECSSPEEVDKLYSALAADPQKNVLFEAVLPRRDTFKNSVIKKANQKAKLQVAQSITGLNMQSQQATYFNQMDRFMLDETASLGDIMYTKYDTKGNATRSKMTAEEIRPALNAYMGNILSRTDIDDKTKNEQVLKLLSHQENSFYANELGDRAVAQLNTLNEPVLPQGARQLLDLRTKAPQYFENAFKPEVIANIDAVAALQDYYGSEKGLNVYISSRERLNDKEYQRTLKQGLEKEKISASGFTNMWSDSESISDSSFKPFEGRIREQMRILMSVGLDKETAKNSAIETVKANNYAYRGTLIPKAIFQGQDPRYAQDGIDALVEAYKKTTGEATAFVEWQPINNRLMIVSGSAEPKFYSTKELRNQYQVAINAHKSAGTLQEDNLNPEGRSQNDLLKESRGDNTYNYDDKFETVHGGRIIRE